MITTKVLPISFFITHVILFFFLEKREKKKFRSKCLQTLKSKSFLPLDKLQSFLSVVRRERAHI